MVLHFSYHQKYLLRQKPTLLRSLNLSPEELKRSTVAAHLNGYVGGFGDLQDAKKKANRLGINREQMEMLEKIMGYSRYMF